MKSLTFPNLIVLSLVLFCSIAYAEPLGGNINAGTGSINQTGTTTSITQQSQNLSIDWQNFSVGANEAVNFSQPNVSAIALNRVFGQDASSILGSITANGQVFILNPNGVLFGSTAQVSVGGLIASTLNISDADFLVGNYSFSGKGGSVINQGSLNAAEGGYIALLAPEVRNEGVITATLGTAFLAAGDKVTLNLNNGSMLSYSIDQGSLNALAENKQLIQADGGQVIMSAQAADALSTAVVNNTGIIEARTIQNVGGIIKLMGDMQVGTVNVGGTLDASAPNGGDGGFIETSAAHVQMVDSAQVTTVATSGNSGTWLIDPYDFTIAATGGDITGAALSAALGSGAVVIQTTNTSATCTGATCGAGNAAGNGDIFVNDVVTWSANLLTLNAWNNIYINANLQGSGTASLALVYGQGAVTAGNASNYFVHAAVDLPAGPNFSTKLGSDGTVKNYTVITALGATGSTTATDLQGMNGNRTANYVLGANIDATATSGWNSGAGFTPVGSALSIAYTGTFDGLGHTISNLVVNRPTTSFVGLFGSVGAYAIIQNVGLSGGSMSGLNYVGGLAGFNRGNISNSYATGNVSGGLNGRVGGLVGENNRPNFSTANINSSFATGNVSAGAGGSAGGLVGYVNTGSQVNNCYATGIVSGATGSYIGGLAGQNNGIINSSFSSGGVSGTSPLYIGGLIGFGFGPVSNSFWDIQTSGQASSYRGTGMLTTADMMTQANFTTWDFANTWFMVDGATRPFLRSEYSTTINNAHQLQLMSMDLGASYTLAANIDLSESALASGMWNTTSGFVPVGSLATPFTGQFDGLTYNISNLTVNLPTTNYVGMFGYISASTVTNANVTGTVTGFDYVGGIVGKTNALSTVSSSSFTGSVTGNSFVGGIVGWNDPSTISNVFVNGSVSGVSSVGGIAGWNDGSTINGAIFSGTVTGKGTADKVGGITGENSGASYISNVIVAGNVNGATNVGGVMGVNTSTGTVSASYWDTQASNQANAVGSGSSTGTTGLTTSQMTQQSSFTGLDFTTTWKIYEGQTAPLLASFLTPLTITLNDAGKTYDGLAYSGGNGYTTSLTPDANLFGSLTYTGTSQGAIDAGNYTISAGGFYSNQQGYDITVVDGSLTVNTAPLTVTANDATKIYGSTQTYLGNEFTSLGLVNSETIGSVTLASTGDAPTANVANGPYAITASAATGGTFNANNYNIIYVDGVLTVSPASLTVTANDASKTYDGLAYSGGNGVTYTGLVNGEMSTVLGGALTYGGTSQGAVNTGSYVITPSGLSSGNYTINYVGGVLTVTAIPPPDVWPGYNHGNNDDSHGKNHEWHGKNHDSHGQNHDSHGKNDEEGNFIISRWSDSEHEYH